MTTARCRYAARTTKVGGLYRDATATYTLCLVVSKGGHVKNSDSSKGRRSKSAGRGTPRGKNHYAWKGDAARPETKRARAQKMYSLSECESCGRQATDRHHKDGDTGNNARSNIALLCRRCHMAEDGRLAAFTALPKPTPAEPKPCINCGKPSKPLRRGRCHACNEYLRRRGRERPDDAHDRSGELNGRSRLTWIDVINIRESLASGATKSELSRVFGVSRAAIWSIENGHTWKPAP